jgi:integrase
MGLGAYPVVSLAEARTKAAEARSQAKAGADPIQRRQATRAAAAAKGITFREAAEATVEAKKAGWSSQKHAAQWLATLEQHAFPMIGASPVASVDSNAVLGVLTPIWTDIPETASRLRGRIEAVLDYAGVRGWRGANNPARWKGRLALTLPSPKKVQRVEHRPALSWAEMPAFMAALSKMQGMGALALRFAILTAARSGEVRGMRWREVDEATDVWTVPAARMKARVAHRVPLSPMAKAVLEEVRALKGGDDTLVFPGAKAGVALSDMSVLAVVRRMNEAAAKAAAAAGENAAPRWADAEGREVVPHGFRSSFRDWARDTRPGSRDAAEAALAHTLESKSEAAYARSDVLETRRALMEAWAQHCTRQPATVASLDAARAARVGA